MENWPPPCVQQYHLCNAFPSQKSHSSASKIFLINFSCDKDQKMPLDDKISKLGIFFEDFLYEHVDGKLATTHEEAAKVESERNNNFPILFFTFLLLLPREIVLEREPTMTDKEHFFLPTARSEYPWLVQRGHLGDGCC